VTQTLLSVQFMARDNLQHLLHSREQGQALCVLICNNTKATMILECKLEIPLRKDAYSFSSGIYQPLFGELASALGQLGQHGNVLGRITCETEDIEDPRLRTIFECLVEHGVPVANDRGGRNRPYQFLILRKYDEDELVAAPYSVPNARKKLASLEWEEDGNFVLSRERVLSAGAFGHVGTYAILAVREEGKQALEEAGLKHLSFERLRVAPPSKRSKPKPIDSVPLWRVGSSLTLPPAKNLCYDNSSRVFDPAIEPGPYKNGFFTMEGYVGLPEMHFHRKALDKVGDFDIAWTFACTGANKDVCARDLVVSPKFREFTKRLGYDVSYHPVRVDDDDAIPRGPLPSWWGELMAKQAMRQKQ